LSPYGFNSEQLTTIYSHVRNDASGKEFIAEKYRLVVDRKYIYVHLQEGSKNTFLQIETIPFTCDVGNKKITISYSDAAPTTFDKNNKDIMIDASNIKLPLTIRNWNEGDYMYPLGMKMKKKKVSDIFINKKIPKHKKSELLFFFSADNLFFVEGIGIDERYKIKEDTKTFIILLFQLYMINGQKVNTNQNKSFIIFNKDTIALINDKKSELKFISSSTIHKKYKIPKYYLELQSEILDPISLETSSIYSSELINHFYISDELKDYNNDNDFKIKIIIENKEFDIITLEFYRIRNRKTNRIVINNSNPYKSEFFKAYFEKGDIIIFTFIGCKLENNSCNNNYHYLILNTKLQIE
jgi:tRNA(Ile)-lysidine synthetase-like protein